MNNKLVLLPILILTMCNSRMQSDQKQTDSLMNAYNNDTLIIRDSPGYRSIRAQAGLSYSSVLEDPRTGSGYAFLSPKSDSVNISRDDSKLIVHYYFYSVGCNDILPYYTLNHDTLSIKYYTVFDAEVVNSERKQEIEFESRSCENIMHLVLTLDHELIERRVVMFKGRNLTK